MKNLFAVLTLAVALYVLLVPAAMKAQDQPAPEAQGGTEPQAGPAVARISVAQGTVSTQHADGGDWAAATINSPLQGGDSISTSDRSRTEVQFDYSNAMRLDQSSVVKIADLSTSRIQLQLSQGLMEYSVLSGGQTAAEIDTPNVSVQPAGDGVYRIQVDPNAQQTWVTVRKGQVQVSTPQGSQNVEAGQTMVIQGTDNPQFQVNAAAGRDEFDQWVENRDRQVLEARSWDHTNRNYTGSEDLDRYGKWEQAPGYGDVWQPYESSDWVPYSDGRWAWEPNYGWTWVDYEPWGWAPYHYGRWFVSGGNWVWWPGPIFPAYRPIWAPAYVSFFGFGGRGWGFGFGFGGGFGSIGWLPLGPFDGCYRWWGAGFHNGYNVVNITNIYNGRTVRPWRGLGDDGHHPRISNVQLANSDVRVRRGVTVASAQNFGSGRVVRQGTPLSEEAFRGAKQVQGGLPVSGTRASLSPSGQFTSRTSLPRAANTNTSFFSRGRAGAFAGGQAGASARMAPPAARGTVGAQTLGSGAAGPNGSRIVPRPGVPQPTGTPTAGMGWQRFGRTGPNATQPIAPPFSRGGIASQNRPPAATAPSQQPGWRRFGTPTPGTARGASQSFPSGPRQATLAPRPVPSNNGSWGRFSQNPAQSPQARPGYSAPRTQPAPSNWSRTAPQYQGSPAPRVGGWSSPAPRTNSYRAPLGSSRPIVSPPRSYTPGGGYSGGGYHPAPSYRPGPSAGYGGGGGGYRPAPSYHAAPSGGYGGGGRTYGGSGGGYHSAPSGGGGGGRSYGGGGGGGHSGGGGGGRSSGGGGHGRH